MTPQLGNQPALATQIETAADQIEGRALPDGGFPEMIGESFRPDATAWAIMALESIGERSDEIQMARSSLAAVQLKDGRVSIDSDHPEAYWPTAVAALAWQDSKQYSSAKDRALKFLLSNPGLTYEKEADSPIGHDTSIKGWTWIAETHSWVEPTALALIVLSSAGLRNDARFEEGIRMLLDRQLPGGGWNFGNTTVLGAEFPPMVDSTGLTLKALAGNVDERQVIDSLGYLAGRAQHAKTPFSLSWALLGLSSWGKAPDNNDSLIERCLMLQRKFGEYTTTNLSLLLLASKGSSGQNFGEKQI